MRHPLITRGIWLAPLLLISGVVVALGDGGSGSSGRDEAVRLTPAAAVGVRYDTLLLGGYATGSFTKAVRHVATGLSESEREMVGQHLDKVFSGVLDENGLGRAGRIRAVFERASRPDGSTRSVRILAAEAAVGGRLHSAFYYEQEGEPGYFDSFGRSVDPGIWSGPLEAATVSSPFGLRRMHPILGRVLPHTGVDYAAATGTPVRATGDGVVVFADTRGGYGKLIEIQHPSGYSTRYAHLSRIAEEVRGGRHVRQGEVIGYVGQTGLATGPHLHYEMRAHGQAVDPEKVSSTGLARQLAPSSGWADEHRRLTALLSRAPTITGQGRAGTR